MSAESATLRAYQEASDQLAVAYRARAELRVGELRQRASLWMSLNDGTRGITAIREEMDIHSTDMTIEVIKVEGEINALLAELRWLDVCLGVEHDSRRD